MIPGRNKHADLTQALKLLLQKFKGVRSYPFQFEKISGNKNKINLAGTGILDNAPESAPDRLSLSIAQAGRESGSRETRIQMEIGCVDKANRFHGIPLANCGAQQFSAEVV